MMKLTGIGILGVGLLIGLFMVPGHVSADRAMSRSKLEKELEGLRESLHEAHRELARKADRIAALEAELKKSEPKPAVKVAAANGSVAPTRVSTESEKKIERETKAAPPRAAKPAPMTFEIRYEKNSAVNYEGREKALEFVRKQLEKSPVALFSVTASANDSSFEVKDQDIARNRARFLVDYLTIKGIPEDAFTRVVGEVSRSEGDSGRTLVITVKHP